MHDLLPLLRHHALSGPLLEGGKGPLRGNPRGVIPRFLPSLLAQVLVKPPPGRARGRPTRPPARVLAGRDAGLDALPGQAVVDVLAVEDPGVKGPPHLDPRVEAPLHEGDKLLLRPGVLLGEDHREGLARTGIDRDVQLTLLGRRLQLYPNFSQPFTVIVPLDVG